MSEDHGTFGGVPLTDELIGRLASEAELGYDVEGLAPCTDLLAAVYNYLAARSTLTVFQRAFAVRPGDPVFASQRDEATGEYRVVWVRNRPALAMFSTSFLVAVSAEVWDGKCLTLPGELRYEPFGLTWDGDYVVARRVGR
jgi:hypothetical protein